MRLSAFQPLPLQRRPEPFFHPDWVYEIKYDGFRALAYVERGEVRLISRMRMYSKAFLI
jgi:ATP-dependent DNA ligase